jgi:hypothetical protein
MLNLREAQQGALEYEAMWDSGELVKRKKKPNKYDIREVAPDDETEYPMGKVSGYNKGPYKRQEI